MMNASRKGCKHGHSMSMVRALLMIADGLHGASPFRKAPQQLLEKAACVACNVQGGKEGSPRQRRLSPCGRGEQHMLAWYQACAKVRVQTGLVQCMHDRRGGQRAYSELQARFKAPLPPPHQKRGGRAYGIRPEHNECCAQLHSAIRSGPQKRTATCVAPL